MSEALWLHGGRVVDPSQGIDASIDVLVVDGAADPSTADDSPAIVRHINRLLE